MKKQIGGDRLGSGNKLSVEMHSYERSTHDLGYVWRSSMAAGTLVPFLKEVALPGDTFDIDLNVDVMTHPTIGPLFGSYKVQVDIFQCPMRLYQGRLQNNDLKIGLNMAQVKLPLLELKAKNTATYAITDYADLDNSQVNPSSILSYLGIRGIGTNRNATNLDKVRYFNAIPYLAYWDIYKNYYANKQEENGVVIHNPPQSVDQNVAQIMDAVSGLVISNNVNNIVPIQIVNNQIFNVDLLAFTGIQDLSQIMIMIGNNFDAKNLRPFSYYFRVIETTAGTIKVISTGDWGTVYYWQYASIVTPKEDLITLQSFSLTNIDDMRRRIMIAGTGAPPLIIDNTAPNPYALIFEEDATGVIRSLNGSQEGLGVKTYQSDLLNNWLSEEWIDGAGGIAEITSIDTTGGSFTMDTLNLAKKVYEMLNRIAMSGGTYDDWIETVYAGRKFSIATTPIYHGGLIKELVFEEVVSQAGANIASSTEQPLGTLAGKGRLGQKHKGGKVTVHVDEPSYIMGIISLTPRLDYSQGNDWDIHLTTLDDLHKPALDEIGFQELITEQMAWWTTYHSSVANEWIQQSAGKQPAWINYMTNINRTRGNFAVKENEMFMTLNRSYKPGIIGEIIDIQDLTTYVDPRIYNQIFAETALDSQNFWVQIGVKMDARRKMSAKLMPNL